MSGYRVSDGQLYGPDGELICEVSTRATLSTRWVRWLENRANTSFSFKGVSGSFSAVKEKRPLKSSTGYYWYAHLQVPTGEGQRRLHHLSLGSINYAKNITLEKMERIAGELARLKLAEAAPGGDRAEWKQAEKPGRQPSQPPPGPLHLSGPAITGGQGRMFDDPDDDPGGGAAYELL
jgi:hypothetical protein